VTFAALPAPGRAIPGSQACFAVSDDGIGIPARYQEAVFDMFRRLHGPDMFGGGGGAGLALARAIAARHGGALWIERSGDDGTTVAFSLPRATPRGDAP
jgi:signal transduction histidine kinase